MSCYRKIINKAFASLLLILLVSFNNTVLAADGEALFKAKCANCHKPDQDYTGPKLQGWKDRQPAGFLYKWVANPAGMIESDAYAKNLFNGSSAAFVWNRWLYDDQRCHWPGTYEGIST